MTPDDTRLEKIIPKRQAALVVERDPANCELATERLRRLGYQVVVCPNPAAAIDWCITSGHRFELLLIGIDWPTFDSVEAIAQLRTHPLTQAMPILVVSSLSLAELQNLGHVTEYLRKPYSRRELEAALNQARRPRVGT